MTDKSVKVLLNCGCLSKVRDSFYGFWIEKIVKSCNLHHIEGDYCGRSFRNIYNVFKYNRELIK